MTEERFTRDYPPFRDEFGCVNNLINGDSYLCGDSAFIGERDAIDTAIEVCRVFNEMYFEKEQLKNRVDELEDDNMKYTLSTDKLEDYTKRFVPTKYIMEFRDCKTNRYYALNNEDNFSGALELLNLLDCENEQLKQEIETLQEQLVHFDIGDVE